MSAVSPTKVTVCARCVMDSTAEEFVSYSDGRCVFCKDFDERISLELFRDKSEVDLIEFAERIKRQSRSKKYDCLIGISGGVDSSYVAHLCSKLGLRVLAVHVDNGWNSELATVNIEGLCDQLNIELETVVLDWGEFRELQSAFISSGISNIEIPTDHAIWASMIKIAAKNNIKYIISGSNAANESIMPLSWLYTSKDSTLIRSIYKRHTGKRLKNYPHLRLWEFVYYLLVRGIRWVPILNHLPFDKEEAKAVLISRYGWRDYGGKHFESIFTRFFHAIYLPEKCGFDLRKSYLSAEICSGGKSRAAALEELASPQVDPDTYSADLAYVAKKLRIEPSALSASLATPRVSHNVYVNQEKIWSMFSRVIAAARRSITRV